ncbi:siderophore-interacting protein [Chitinophaga sp. LS1]|uniref:siderophore-interacting protein n=1 Tax=Chitinophaga sp. LS1 TaxID=3051176 RepID=UPI002AAAFFA7|nr:siderophore-interacting protein [Chitinophaga sp. LS1]WPV66253.1 siderophore-interacting protein [Chitinophaga sp. LS1]
MPNVPKWVADQMENLLPSKFMNIEVGDISQYSREIKVITFHTDLSKIDCFPGSAINFRVSDTEIRHYTPVDFNKTNGTFDIYFHIHGNGPGSHLADQLTPGDHLKVSVPGGRKIYDPGKHTHFFFGDETSLGFYISLLGEINKNNGKAFGIFELNEPDLPTPYNIRIVPKTPDAALAELDKYINEYREAIFYLTGNVASVQQFRTALKKHDVSSRNIKLQGYWAEGSVGL